MLDGFLSVDSTEASGSRWKKDAIFAFKGLIAMQFDPFSFVAPLSTVTKK